MSPIISKCSHRRNRFIAVLRKLRNFACKAGQNSRRFRQYHCLNSFDLVYVYSIYICIQCIHSIYIIYIHICITKVNGWPKKREFFCLSAFVRFLLLEIKVTYFFKKSSADDNLEQKCFNSPCLSTQITSFTQINTDFESYLLNVMRSSRRSFKKSR